MARIESDYITDVNIHSSGSMLVVAPTGDKSDGPLLNQINKVTGKWTLHPAVIE